MFPPQQTLVREAARISQAKPRKVEEFMYEDTGKLYRRAVQGDGALREKRTGVHQTAAVPEALGAE
jgi:hypothetical protein